MGDFESARSVADESLRIADVHGHAYSLCHACLGLGGTRVRQGEFEAAVSILGRGLALTDRVPLLRPPLAADLGLARAHTGGVDEGLTLIRSAVDSATSMGRLSRLPLILVKCAEVHLLAGDAAEATRLAGDALRLATEQEERGNVVYAWHMLGEIGARAGTLPSETTQRHFQQALELATELQMKAMGARCHAALGRALVQRGDPRAGQRHLAVARTLFREMGMRFWLARLDAEAGESVAADEPLAAGGYG